MEEFDLENPFLEDHQSDTIESLFASELNHLPCHDYIPFLKANADRIALRQQAVSSILNTQFSCKLDPFVSYLAVNYFDRFISKHGFPEKKKWFVKLASVSCLLLAAKMKKIGFTLDGLQGDAQMIFDPQTVHRMEILILGALKWQLRSVTPFSFIYFFLSLLNLRDPPLLKALKARATEIAFRAQNEISLLEFKPSVVSASALLIASHELSPLQFPDIKHAISSCPYINNDELGRCCGAMEDAMEDAIMDGYKSVLDMASSSNTAVNVLDRNWSSSGSESTTEGVVGSLKRRRVDDV